ncbi:MAG: Rid family hydrolase [Acidobacteriota bacterium]|jgi:enamine deaminase RidA (YjgF/YER057c/UK114 family)
MGRATGRRGTITALLLAAALTTAAARGAGEKVRHVDEPGRSGDLPFAHLVVAGDTVYLSGVLGLDPETRKVPEDPAVEVRRIMDTIRNRLALVDLTPDDLVSVQVFCSDVALYGTFNEVYRTYFQEHFPARAFVGSGPLLFDARFEVQGIAVRH